MKLKIVRFLALICLLALAACHSSGGSGNTVDVPAPASISASCANNSMTVSWPAVNGAESYSLFISTEQDGEYTPIMTTDTLSVTISGLNNETTYWVKEASINSIGTGDFSAPVSCIPGPRDTVPVKPGSFFASSGDSTASLQWAAADKADSYNIYKVNPNGTITLLKSLTDLSHTVTGLTNGESYLFFVTAVNENGESEGSERLNVTPVKAVSAPSAPANLSAATGNTRVVLNWEESSGASSYAIYRSSEEKGEYTIMSTVSGLTYTAKNLTNDKIYWFKVAGINTAGIGAQSAAVSATPTVPATPPAGVIGFNATAGDSQIELAWNPAANTRSYNIYMSNSQNGPFTLVGNTSRNSYSASGLTNGNVYWFRVSGVNAAGEGPLGAAIFALAAAPINVPAAPAAVNGLSDNASAALSWSASQSASSYTVYQSESPNGVYSTVATLSTLNHTVYGLTNGTTYWFTVAATNSAGTGVKSYPVSVTPAVPITVAPVPAGLSAIGSDSAVILSWDASSGATQYYIYQSTGTDAYVKIKSTISNNDNITGLTNGQIYNFKVSAVNEAGESELSTPASATPEAPIRVPTSPSGINIAAGDSSAVITWEPVSSANSYVIYQSDGMGGYITLATVSTSPYTVTGLANGTQYSFKIASANSAGIGVQSAAVSVTPAVPIVVPATPTWISALPGDTTVSLQWSEPAGAQSYYVYQSIDNTQFARVKSTTSASAEIEGLTNGQTYYFKVSAANSAGESQMSNSAGLIPRETIAIPGIPSAVNITAGNGSMTISWASVPQAYSYVIYGNSSENGTYVTVSNVTTSPYTLSGLTNGTTYWFKVAAQNAAGTGSASAPVPVTPMAPITVPAVPSAISASVGDANASLSWPAVSGTTYYNVYESSAENGTYTLIKTVNAPLATITELTNGQTYWYKISAANSAGESSTSVAVSAMPKAPLQAPLAPLGLNVTNSSSAVILSWTASANADTYTIQTSSSENGVYTPVATTAITSYRVAGLTNGQIYWFKISASNAAGASALSTAISGAPVAPITVLPAPNNINIAPGDRKLTIVWAPVTGALRYKVYVSTTLNGYYSLMATSDDTSEIITGLINNNVHYVKISTVNQVGEGPQSNAVTATPSAPLSIPDTPTGLSAVAGNSKVTLSWNSSGATSSYSLYRSTSQNGAYTQIISTMSSPFSDTGLTNGQAYWYKVSAANSAGESPRSAAISATPTAPVTIPAVPTGLSASPANEQVMLTWSAVSGATSYNIYSAKAGSGFILNGSSVTPAYTAQNLLNNIVYQFTVSAVNSAGESARSQSVSAKPVANILPAPTNLVTIPLVSGATLTWDIVTGANGYTVFMSQTGQQGPYTNIGNVTGNIRTFTVTNLTPLGSYWFKVKANKNGESSDFSQPVSVITMISF